MDQRKIISITMLCVAMIIAVPLTNADIITIMSANITSGSSQSYEAAGIRIFQGLQPDIVLIQEFNTSGSLRTFVDEAFGTEYEYHIEPGGESLPNGVISRYPIISAGQWTDPYVYNRDFAWAVIDIPGALNLQVVSVHLLSSDAGTRNNQAQLIKDHVAADFDDNQYIVVGGDLNTTNRSEAAVDTFKLFLDADDHRPVDQNNNSYTSEPRSRPYDWVMPNHRLDEQHRSLIIESSEYINGLVFDSEVYTPLNEVYPVQYGDSHVSGMQHMAVMKAYETGNFPSPTPTPTPQVTPTSTPVCSGTGVSIWMPYFTYYPGFTCSCVVTICNAENYPLLNYPLFVVLDVYGSYYFAPSFNDYDYYEETFPVGETSVTILDEFVWPSGVGSADGIIWYAALTNPAVSELFGTMDTFTFGWNE